jgi:hypothetical protein
LISIFNNFILDVIYPETIDDRKLELISPSIYLNFNYTDTLQRYYGVKVQDICYIHEKSSKNDCKIILGHGTDPSNFEVNEPKPPNGLNEYELERWWEYMSDQYDYSYESAKDEILSYYTKAFKNTHSIIDKKICFFETLINVECIYVLGHSISEIDSKYFETVKKYVIPNAMWIVTFYSDNEKQKHLEAMTKLGVLPENLNQIKMTDLK